MYVCLLLAAPLRPNRCLGYCDTHRKNVLRWAISITRK